MARISTISSPDDPALEDLCRELALRAAALEEGGRWPRDQWKLCAAAGVPRWFLPKSHGGFGWSEADQLRGYFRLSAACLTTAFVLTQFAGACRRIAIAENQVAAQSLLEDLVSGKTFATVGISHLTTSRRHVGQPVMRAEERGDTLLLDGYTPWVTGAIEADSVVLGATLDDGRQILASLPTHLQGVIRPKPPRLIALTGSQTGELRCQGVVLERKWLLAGPVENVMSRGDGARTGGLATSALAAGLSSAAIDFLGQEAVARSHLQEATDRFASELQELTSDLLRAAAGEGSASSEDIRARANSLALRSTQATLAAAKGAGFLADHPAGRWCREALFFLVWSCPQPVLSVNLCELAGL